MFSPSPPPSPSLHVTGDGRAQERDVHRRHCLPFLRRTAFLNCESCFYPISFMRDSGEAKKRGKDGDQGRVKEGKGKGERTERRKGEVKDGKKQG